MSFRTRTTTRGAKSSSGGGRGWAAFDHEQRLKRQGLLENDVVEDPFPALPSKPEQTTSTTNGTSSSSSSRLKMSSWWRAHQARGLIQHNHHSNNNSDDVNNIKQGHDVVGSSSTESTRKDLHCDSGTELHIDSERLEGVPIEPEWEDEYDDVYFTHRKHALRTMRSASQHSKAASNAYLRGDHVSAQQHSLKAHQQWLAAQTLNAKAAMDILAIRNSHHDVWNLDLHGLHAAEAIQILQQHLHNIETKLVCNRSVSPNSLNMETTTRSIVRSNSLESFGCVEDKQQQASLKQRPTSLQVITGVGNHSRGQASLPVAVRGFLNENGYRFEELKPGVITVRPKFRLSS